MKFEPPKRHTASHILGEFYHRCRGLGLDVWLDYHMRNRWNRLVRVNAAIVVDEEVVCFVWIRCSYNAARHIGPKRYRLEKAGVPLVIIRGMMRVPSAMTEVVQLVTAWRQRKEIAEAAVVEQVDAIFGS